MEEFQGKVWKLGDDIDTDIILPTEYLVFPTIAEMKPYAFSPLRPELAGKIEPGDIIVGGENFGCGSSKSFARIFFRNAINNGLLLIECRDLPDEVSEGDTLTVTVGEKIRANGKDYKIAALPENLMEILNAGGLVKAMRKRNGLN